MEIIEEKNDTINIFKIKGHKQARFQNITGV
jgi:hypothetical protein